jgi:hypothetical protein
VDVHKKTMVACLIVPGSGATPRKEIRTFGTMTADLLALVEWLVAAGCTHVAMESTGVYWKPPGSGHAVLWRIPDLGGAPIATIWNRDQHAHPPHLSGFRPGQSHRSLGHRRCNVADGPLGPR